MPLLPFDNEENELTTVVVNGQTTTFTYDAAGIRVKTMQPNGTITDYPFPGYEVQNPTAVTPLIRRTTFLAGQTIAINVSGDPVGTNNGLFFIYSDHLGSTSMLHKSGQSNPFTGSTTRYLPFGGYRGTPPSQAITDRDFTGQRENMEVGLLYYNARYYLPGIARFISADTLVPNPTNPQSWNRYSYTNNNPVRFTDPTGHCVIEDDIGGQCTPVPPPSSSPQTAASTSSADPRPTIPTGPMVDFTGDWSGEEWKQEPIQQAALILGWKFSQVLNELHPGWNLTSKEAFLLVYGGTVSFNHMGVEHPKLIGGYTNDQNSIDVYTRAMTHPIHWAIHELGHAFNHAIDGVGDDMLIESRAEYGIPIRTGRSEEETFGFAGTHRSPLHWQQSTAGNDAGEEFADMMIGWAYNRWDSGPGQQWPYSTIWSSAGQGRSNFMTDNMAYWLSLTISG